MSHDASQFDAFVAAVFSAYRSVDTNVAITPDMWKAGRLAMGEMKDSPFVCWVRAGGRLEKTERPGPHVYDYDDGGTIRKLWFKAVYDDLARIEAHIVGETPCQTEQVWNGLLRATRDVIGSWSMPGEYRYFTQEAGEAAWMHAGQEKIIQMFEWRLLVPDEFGEMTTLTAAEHSACLNDTPDC